MSADPRPVPVHLLHRHRSRALARRPACCPTTPRHLLASLYRSRAAPTSSVQVSSHRNAGCDAEIRHARVRRRLFYMWQRRGRRPASTCRDGDATMPEPMPERQSIVVSCCVFAWTYIERVHTTLFVVAPPTHDLRAV